jgi:hypothetical protein
MDNQYLIDCQKIVLEHQRIKIERLEKQIRNEYVSTYAEMLTALEQCWDQFADYDTDKDGFIIGREHRYINALENTYDILLQENIINKEGLLKKDQNKKRHISKEI